MATRICREEKTVIISQQPLVGCSARAAPYHSNIAWPPVDMTSNEAVVINFHYRQRLKHQLCSCRNATTRGIVSEIDVARRRCILEETAESKVIY